MKGNLSVSQCAQYQPYECTHRCVCVSVRARVCLRACACVCAPVCVRACACVYQLVYLLVEISRQ